MKFNEKKFKAWEKTRQKGLLKYMIVDGCILLGLPIGIGVSLLHEFIFNTPEPWRPQLLLHMVIGGLIAWPMWILNEISRKAYFEDHGNELSNL